MNKYSKENVQINFVSTFLNAFENGIQAPFVGHKYKDL